MTPLGSDKERDGRYDVCTHCDEPLYKHLVEVFNDFHEVGAYCINQDCPRYRLLVP